MRPGLRARARAAGARVTGRRRTVLQAYDGLRLGNVLYFALHAHTRRGAGEDYRVRDPGLDASWLTALPALAEVLLPPEQVRWTDAREQIPPSFLQGFGSDFTASELAAFVAALADDPALVGIGDLPADTVVVNVRRGDYYTVPEFRQLFGFDVPRYVGEAVAQAEVEHPVARIVVVSDDIAWCRGHLGILGSTGAEVCFEPDEPDPVRDLRRLAGARRLVLTNSTFSYWGGYLSNARHGNHGQVWVPDLHSRGVCGGRPWQHDPRWRAVAVLGPEPAL